MDLAKRREFNLVRVRDFAAREVVNLGRFPTGQPLVVFDCGAHHGIWTEAFFATHPEAKIEAHLFEPSEQNCKWIRELHDPIFGPCRRGHSMKLNQLAVGENEETRTFYAPKPGSGLASLYDRPDAPTTITEQVHVTTLDAYVDREKIARIDLLKLDVEGWEWRALKGARRLLGEEKIGAVYFEFSPLNVFTRTFFHDLWQVLQPAGFYFFYVDPQQGYRLRPIPEYSGEWEKFDGTSYYYAKHKNLAVEPVLVA